MSLMCPQTTLDPNFHQRICADVIEVILVEKCNRILCCFAIGRNEQEAAEYFE